MTDKQFILIHLVATYFSSQLRIHPRINFTRLIHNFHELYQRVSQCLINQHASLEIDKSLHHGYQKRAPYMSGVLRPSTIIGQRVHLPTQMSSLLSRLSKTTSYSVLTPTLVSITQLPHVFAMRSTEMTGYSTNVRRYACRYELPRRSNQRGEENVTSRVLNPRPLPKSKLTTISTY